MEHFNTCQLERVDAARRGRASSTYACTTAALAGCAGAGRSVPIAAAHHTPALVHALRCTLEHLHYFHRPAQGRSQGPRTDGRAGILRATTASGRAGLALHRV